MLKESRRCLFTVWKMESFKSKAYVLRKDKALGWLKSVSGRGYSVIAPVSEDDTVRFKQLSSFNEKIDLDSPTNLSPKTEFLPQYSTLLRFQDLGDGKIKVIPAEDSPEKIVLFGVHACDASAMKVLDEHLSEYSRDEAYDSRRKNTIVVGVSCRPDAYCFCTSLKMNPTSKEGSDIFLTDLGSEADKFYVEVLSDRGESVIDEGFFEKPSREDLALKEKTGNALYEKVTKKFDSSNAEKNLDLLFDDSFWENESRRCIGCSICTFLCPTCSCFDVCDEVSVQEGLTSGERLKCWDNCQQPDFTLMAGGVNPRKNKADRLKQRLYHKFNYMPKRIKKTGCTGCGRCVRYCPVDISIPEIITEVNSKAEDKKT